MRRGFLYLVAIMDWNRSKVLACQARENRLIERLWRLPKYECLYLSAFETGSEMRSGISKWLTCSNSERPHSTHAY